jgi:hypothetical protein
MIDESDRQRHGNHRGDEEQNVVQREKREFAVNDIGASRYEDGEGKFCREKEDQKERDVNREFPSGANLVLLVENRVNDRQLDSSSGKKAFFCLFPENSWHQAHSPPFSRRGGCAINKKTPFLDGADGVVGNFKQTKERYASI